MLVFYVTHMTNAIRIDTIMRMVERTARSVLHRDHPQVDESCEDPDAQDASPIPEGAVTLAARGDGYVQGVAEPMVAGSLAERRLSVRLLPLVGYHVVDGEPLAAVWCDDGSAPPEAALAAVADVIIVVPERLAELDLGFDIRQLVEMSNRAMGTTQNDPYTAVQAVHHLTALLSDAARRSFAPRSVADANGRTCATVPIMDFPTDLKVVCGHVRQGGAERHPRVTLELLRLLGSVAASAVGERRRSAVDRELELVVAGTRRSIPPRADLDEMEATHAQARARLDTARRRAGGAAEPVDLDAGDTGAF
jgi:uncharacterized membrane protein